MLAFGLAWFFESQATTTVIFTRHADIDPAGGADQGLSPAGEARAAELLEVKTKTESELAEVRSKAESELAETKSKAEAELAETKSKAEAELAETKSKAAAELAEALLAAAPAGNPNAPQKERGRGVLLNLNVPRDWTRARGVAYARLGQRFYDEVVDMRKDPRGRDYCWIGGPGVHHDDRPGTDTSLFNEGRATVSPLILDLGDEAGAPFVEHLVRGMV